MKSIIIIFSGILTLNCFAQSNLTKTTQQLTEVMNSSTDSEELLVWVFFTDKGKDLSSYLAKPQSIVSERSLKRRSKVLPKEKLISNIDLPVNEEYVVELVNKGLKVKHRSKWFNGVSGYATKSQIGIISQSSVVKKIDVVQKFKEAYPIDEDKSSNFKQESILKQNNVHSLNYGSSFTQVNQINVPAVHDLGFIGQDVLICSMDAGFDNLAHEVFNSMNIVAMWDFVDNDADVSRGGSHGTSTLSLIGGFKEGQLIGTAFGSDYLLARTEDIFSETPIEEDNWITAIEWADSIGVDVTTTSLSYLTYDAPFPSYTWEDMDGNTARITIAADLAVGLGIVVVNSAGNEGYNPDHSTLWAPADGDSVITVGAVTSSGNRASFSSVGPTADGRIKPDLMAMGSGVYYATSSSSSSYGSQSVGTSFSCPLLAGAAALLLSAHPNLTPMEVLDIFRQTASRSNNPDNLMGWGIINTLDAINFISLPVELTSFTGRYVDGEVRLNWTTATESNNYGFEVEKRYEETLFETIGFVAGIGSSTVAIQYSFIDDNIIDNKIFYRLKQIDLNGEFIHFGEIMVDADIVSGYQLFQNHPNPFNPGTTINYSVPKPSEIKIVLYDIIGNEIEKLYEGMQQEGIHQIDFNGGNLASGVYFVAMTSDNFFKTIKISLLK